MIALVLDQLLEPVDDEYSTYAVDVGEVTGVEESVGIDCRFSGFFVAEVADYYVGSTDT